MHFPRPPIASPPVVFSEGSWTDTSAIICKNASPNTPCQTPRQSQCLASNRLPLLEFGRHTVATGRLAISDSQNQHSPADPACVVGRFGAARAARPSHLLNTKHGVQHDPGLCNKGWRNSVGYIRQGRISKACRLEFPAKSLCQGRDHKAYSNSLMCRCWPLLMRANSQPGQRAGSCI
jgi:hypothetical protein